MTALRRPTDGAAENAARQGGGQFMVAGETLDFRQQFRSQNL